MVSLIPRRRTIRRLAFYTIILFLIYQLAKLVLPADNIIFLSLHSQKVYLHSLFHSKASTDSWIRSSTGPYAMDFSSRVGLLIKTGYGTRERLPAQLEALGLDKWDPDRAVVVGDFEQDANATAGAPVIQDAVGSIMRILAPKGLNRMHRFKRYGALKKAIDDKDERRAGLLASNVGWELDALKTIWGLGALFRTLPPKDWYIILDDDSFLVTESLTRLLSHLDPTKPHYLGNTLGNTLSRFAHGGSAIVLSRAVLEKLFRTHPDAAAEAQVNSLSETWGDKLVAATLRKLNVYIDERFSHFFNGEVPLDTRIASDRFCSPLVSFHGLKKPEEMRELGRKFRERGKRLTVWADVWDMFGGANTRGFNDRPMRQDHDYLGEKLDEGKVKTSKNVPTAERCMRLCMRQRKKCLAWRWEMKSRECYTNYEELPTSRWKTAGCEVVWIIQEHCLERTGTMSDKRHMLTAVFGLFLEPDAGDDCTRTKKELGRMGSANVVACPVYSFRSQSH